uniref:Rab-like protein n=1 Tax=Trepomonas sp. PC1 TaxID=1076344 RepID=A0A146K9K7_9EUKA|eukprot:JAP92109.1 Rab-like protein [Trepomonas sp. PC1]
MKVNSEVVEINKGKVVLAGSSASGKTSLSLRIQNQKFDTNLQATIQTMYSQIQHKIQNYNVQFGLWDTAGQEKYLSITAMYLRSADIALLVFDQNSPSSFEQIPYWIEQFRAKSNKETLFFLIQNKIDLESRIQQSEVEQLAFSYDMKLFKVSAKTGQGVEALLDSITLQLATTNCNEEQKTIVMQNYKQPGKQCCK